MKRHAQFHIRVSVAAALVVLLLASNASIRAQTSQQTPSANPQFREVIDEVNRPVRIPRSVQRIVSLAPSLTETVYALGLQDHLVGDTNFCDYPPDAQKKQKVGDTLNPSLEEIAALHPDVVLAIVSLNRPDTVHALESLKIPVYAADPHTIDQIISSTRRLADVLGVPDAGASVAADLEHRLDVLHQRLVKFPPRRVLFVVWDQPLMSVGQDTFIADALRYAGATSIVDSRQGWPQMSLEEVARLQPDFLVFPASHGQSVSVDVDALAARPGWRGLEAVRNRHFAVISDAVNRPAPRIVSAIEDLARQLHPEAFDDKNNAAPAAPAAFSPADENGSQECRACSL